MQTATQPMPHYGYAPQPAQDIPVPQPAQHQPAPSHTPAAKKSRISFKPAIIVAVLLALAAAAGGYYLLKPKEKPSITPTQLAQKSSFSFYYPKPLPAGYSYVDDINTFEGGQAYYMIGKGRKHMIIHEQQSSSSKLNLKDLTKPTTLKPSTGLAAIGTTAGQTSGAALINGTLININTTGSVPLTDVTDAIMNLKVLPRQ
jgi:hypothetical protein